MKNKNGVARSGIEFKARSGIEFQIICIKDCKSLLTNNDIEIKKGDIFLTNEYNFYWPNENDKGESVRLIKDFKIMAICDNSNFMKLDDWRNTTIDDLLN